MSFLKLLAAYGATTAVFFAIDLVWLIVMNPRFYKPQLAAYMSDKVNWLPAVLFYLLFTFGLLVLVILPAVERGSWMRAMLWGGLLGMIAYATYDLTNLASIKNWPLSVTVVDITWGTILSAATATAGYFLTKLIQ